MPALADRAPRRGAGWTRPLPIGWMVLVIGGVLYVAGSNIGSGWVIILTAAMAGALALDLLAVWRTHRGTTVGVRLPASATTTEAADLRLEVVRPDLGTTLQVADADGRSRAVVRTSTAAVRLPLPLARGRHEGLVILARTIGPLGLAHATGRHAADGGVRCRPGALPADARVRALVGARAAAAGQVRRGDDDVRGVREHTSSDPRRAVHWRATARHGRLMVRESEAAGGADLHLGIAGGTWTATALDLACEVVAGIGEAATAAGHAVHLRVDGATHAWDAATWHDLSALPPAAGVAARPLAPTDGPALWVRPAATGIAVDGHVLRDREEVARWLRSDA